MRRRAEADSPAPSFGEERGRQGEVHFRRRGAKTEPPCEHDRKALDGGKLRLADGEENGALDDARPLQAGRSVQMQDAHLDEMRAPRRQRQRNEVLLARLSLRVRGYEKRVRATDRV